MDSWGASWESLTEPAAPSPRRSEVFGLAERRAFGGLLSLLDVDTVRDVFVQVHGGKGELWVDWGGGPARDVGWQATPEEVRSLAVALIAAGGRHLDELHPCVDVKLGAGIRVHAVLPPIAVQGAAVSIRVPSSRPWSLVELVVAGLADESWIDYFARVIKERRNFLVTGGTGSGKTTLLNALLGLVSERERLVTIEDVAELRVQHPHVVSLESRQPNAEGVGEIGLDRLLREALRMRPDRIVLGECRGAEIATLLTAFNTGHDGGAGTLHASSLFQVPTRLEALGGLAGLDRLTLARHVVTAIHLVVHVERGPSGHRITGVGVPRLASDGSLAIGEAA